MLLFCCCTWLAASAVNAQAQESPENIDLTRFTCQEYLQRLASASQPSELDALITWLDGYLSGISGNTEINWREIAQYRLDLTAHCRKHSSSTLQEAARKAGM